jgi:hypothetical protein
LGAGAGRKKRVADDGGEVTHGRGGDDGDAEGSLSYTWAQAREEGSASG